MGNVNNKPKGQADKDPAKDPKYLAMVAAAKARRAEEKPTHGSVAAIRRPHKKVSERTISHPC